jgi:hypothetical protein
MISIATAGWEIIGSPFHSRSTHQLPLPERSDTSRFSGANMGIGSRPSTMNQPFDPSSGADEVVQRDEEVT